MEPTQHQPFFIGTYSTEGPYVPEAQGAGIISCSLETETGTITQLHSTGKGVNATYLRKNQNQLFVACDRFEETGAVHVYTIEADTSLALLAQQSTHGNSSCHVETDRTGETVYVASYASALLSCHHFNGKEFAAAPQLLTYEGSGPNRERQEASHPHQAVVSPCGCWLYACDLGSDTIWVHELLQDGRLKKGKGIPAPPGSGPRHLVFHQKLGLVFVFCELTATILTYSHNSKDGMLELLSETKCLPAEFSGTPAGAAIRLHPSIKALYVSNRNHHSISAFSISGKRGSLHLETCFPIQGEEPRDFNIDPSGQWLLSANQNTHEIVPFRLDPQTGLPTGENSLHFSCGTPVCIEF